MSRPETRTKTRPHRLFSLLCGPCCACACDASLAHHARTVTRTVTRSHRLVSLLCGPCFAYAYDSSTARLALILTRPTLKCWADSETSNVCPHASWTSCCQATCPCEVVARTCTVDSRTCARSLSPCRWCPGTKSKPVRCGHGNAGRAHSLQF